MSDERCPFCTDNLYQQIYASQMNQVTSDILILLGVSNIQDYPLTPPIGEPSWQQAFLAGYEIGYREAMRGEDHE